MCLPVRHQMHNKNHHSIPFWVGMFFTYMMKLTKHNKTMHIFHGIWEISYLPGCAVHSHVMIRASWKVIFNYLLKCMLCCILAPKLPPGYEWYTGLPLYKPSDISSMTCGERNHYILSSNVVQAHKCTVWCHSNFDEMVIGWYNDIAVLGIKPKEYIKVIFDSIIF